LYLQYLRSYNTSFEAKKLKEKPKMCNAKLSSYFHATESFLINKHFHSYSINFPLLCN